MAAQDESFSFSVAANFADDDTSHGDTITFSATLADGSALPSWLDFDEITGVFSGAPTAADLGAIDVTVTASDTFALSASDTFTLSVENYTPPPPIQV